MSNTNYLMRPKRGSVQLFVPIWPTYSGDDYLVPYFKVKEMRCKSGNTDVFLLCATLMEQLVDLRVQIGQPINIVSGYRTPAHNRKIKGAAQSRHMLGLAADISIAGMTGTDIAIHAHHAGFERIGIKEHTCHVDVDLPESDYFDFWNYGIKGLPNEAEFLKLVEDQKDTLNQLTGR